MKTSIFQDMLNGIHNGEALFELIDLFCGAGGLTKGAEKAQYKGIKLVDVIACVNHDDMAIKSHAANHPDCIHFTEDIRKLLVTKLPARTVGKFLILHASLECTNFSNAKGGLPRDADSRTLAEDLFRYLDHLNPDYITIENVREFMAWGPLDELGKPISRDKGKDYLAWVSAMKSRGYEYQFRLLNSADFGAYTSRLRYFGIFAKKGLPIVWPQPTHAKKPVGHLQKWKPVREVLELEEKGESIFGRKKPLSENTLKRIYAGLLKYVAHGDESFIKKYYSGNPNDMVISVSQPTGAFTTTDSHALVSSEFLVQPKGGKVNPQEKSYPTNRPSRTVATGYHDQLIQPEFLVKYFGKSKVGSTDEPTITLTTNDRLALVNCHQFIDKNYSGEANHQAIDQPAGSVLTKDKYSLVSATEFMSKSYSSGQPNQSANEPSGSVTTVPKLNVVQVDEAWLLNPNYSNVGKSLDEPAPPQMACRKHQYIMNPQFAYSGKDIDSPSGTLIARMDKKPPYLITGDEGVGFIIIYESDSETMKKIKLFMAAYGIIDIKMRMLMISELKRIQGFGNDYILLGTKTQQKKFIGNAVVPVIPEVWYSALGKVLLENYPHFIQIAA